MWATDDCGTGESGVLAGISDHLITFLELRKPPKETDTNITCRSYKDYNKEMAQNLYADLVTKSDLKDHIQKRNLDDAVEEWIRILRNVCDTTAPIKTIKIPKEENSVPWFNSEVHHLKNVKKSLLTIQHKDRHPLVKERIRAITNKLKSIKRKLKREYLTKKIDEKANDGKKLWELLREATNTKAEPCDIEPDNVTQQQADEFNAYFANVGRSVQQRLGMHETGYQPNINREGFGFTPETSDTVEKMIQDLRITVATGSCQTPARILRDLSEAIRDDLRDLINLSFSVNTFPTALKHAWIKAIHKNKGNTEEPEYYRPISILPVVSKIFERSATRQLVAYLEENDGLYEGQHAYRRHHSTTTCLMEITEEVHAELDRGGVMGIASMDLSKAFDSVSHSLLLRKLERKGLGGACLKWLQSYLTNRTQQVRFKKFTSKTTTTQSGVPQGSVLGPILFIALTSDLVDHLDGE